MQALMSIQYYVEPENVPIETIQDEDKDIFNFKYQQTNSPILTISVSCYTTKLFAQY